MTDTHKAEAPVIVVRDLGKRYRIKSRRRNGDTDHQRGHCHQNCDSTHLDHLSPLPSWRPRCADLAGLTTRAERDGDEFIVNGQKTWTTLGQHANMIFCLVRTSKEGKPQEGISFLLIDMDSPAR